MAVETTLLAQLPLFMLATLLLNAMPGVDLLLTVSRTAQAGARAGAAAASGVVTGCAVHALAASFGLAALLAVSTQAFTLLKWAGAAYLLWLGVGMLRAGWRRPEGLGSAPALLLRHAPEESVAADFRRGLLTNLLNPKVALFMLAFVPQFIPAQATHKTAAFLALGALFIAQSWLFLLAVVAFTARAARTPWLAGRARWLHTAGGLLFISLALRLAGARNGTHV
jgi:threonine/homoserine/homoserine lactone efflux protein